MEALNLENSQSDGIAANHSLGLPQSARV